MVKLKQLHWHIVRQEDSFRLVQTPRTFQGKISFLPFCSYFISKIRFHHVCRLVSCSYFMAPLCHLCAGYCSVLIKASPDITGVNTIYNWNDQSYKTSKKSIDKSEQQWQRAKRCEWRKYLSFFSHSFTKIR